MSKIKTYPVTESQLTDLMKALNLNRDDIPRVCGGISASAYGWWKNQGKIPLKHLISFRTELQRQSKLRPKSELDKKVESFLTVAIAVMDASGSAAPFSKQSPLQSALIAPKRKATTMRDLLKTATREELIDEVLRRGGTVSFGLKRSRKTE